MIFGKDQEKFDFNSFKGDVNQAADPLIDAVVKYEPNKKKRRYQSDTSELPQTAGLFFKAAADTLDKKSSGSGDSSEESASLGERVKDLRLDKKAGKAGKVAKEAGDEAGKRAGRLLSAAGDTAGKAGDTIKDAKLDKKLGGVVETVSGALLGAASTVGDTVKDAKLDKKLASVGDTVKDAKLDKKIGHLVETVSDTVKDAKLDKKLAGAGEAVVPVALTVADTAGAVASNVAEGVSSFIKDNKLDKKAAGLVESAGGAIKDARLDKKLAKAGKTLGQAELPEKVFEAANILPGVTVKNPRKAAKQFRKRRAEAIKAARQQQKELGKLLAHRQKDAQKFIKARQKDIETGKIRLPFVEPKKKRGFPWLPVLGGAGLTYGGLAANNARVWNSVAPLESKLPGDSRYYRSRQGIVFYKEAGQGGQDSTPVVFVHGIGAGNNSYEFSQNFEAIAQQHKAYALDLLGFGNSDRPKVKYTAEFYIKQLTEFLDEVVKQPAYLVASSLSAAYAVQVAFRRPELVKKLVLNSPTGINKGGGKRAVQTLPGFTYALLRSPVLGKAIYSAVASKASIRSFMQNQMFYDKNRVSDEMVQQYYTAAHQQGAEYAPPSFFTGLLDAEIGQTLGKLTQPVLMFFGKESLITPMWEGQALKQQNPAAEMVTLDRARLSVNWEQAEEFNRRTLEFFSRPDEAGQSQAQNQALKPSDLAGVSLGQSDSLQNQAGVSDQQATGNKVEQAAKELSQEFLEMADQEHRQAEAQLSTDAGTLEAATEYQGNRDVNKELQQHRETFVGDADTGAALVEDKDRNGVDDRRMGNGR